MKKIILLMLIAAPFFSACKKDHTCNKDVASIAASYKVTAASYKATPTSQPIDFMDFIYPEPCQKDDVLNLLANGTYELKDVGTVCTPAGDDGGTWSIAANNLVIDGDPATIESFDCKTLVISTSDIDVAGDKMTLTLVKQ